MSSATIWTNKEDGNNHGLTYFLGDHSSQLVLIVTKPDSTSCTLTARTSASAEEWRTAFADLGPEWNQKTSNKVENRFTATRTAEAANGEVLTWGVDHDLVEGKYVLNDTLDNSAFPTPPVAPYTDDTKPETP